MKASIKCEVFNQTWIEQFDVRTPEGMASFVERVKVLTCNQVPFDVAFVE